MTRAACFVDRDGTLMVDTHYPSSPDRVKLIPGVADALARCNARNIPVIVVTNQSGIARGLITPAQYEAVRDRLDQELLRQGAHADATYHCPHGANPSDACDCRKPGLGMYQRAAQEHALDLSRSIYIGDRWSDVQPALATGGIGVLIPGPDTRADHIELARAQAHIMPTLDDAITYFLSSMQEAA